MNAQRYGWIRWLAVAAAAAATGCGQADVAPAEGQVAETVRVVNVEVQTVAPSTFVDYIRATGEVEALSDVTVSAQETGVVREFYVAKGATLREGQPIVKIDDAVLTAQADEARAAARLAGEQFERLRQVWETQKIGSEIGYLQAKSQADAAAARLAGLEARLERTLIRSPLAGVFDAKTIEVGEMVMPGTPIGRVVTAHRVQVTAGIPERFAADLETGTAARVTFDIFPGRAFTGRVSFVGTSVDPDSRTFPVEIVLENPERVIKPRMVADVQVVRARLAGVVVVPQNVVLRTEAGYQAFVVVERDGTLWAEARPVTLGPSHENRVVIRSGLTAGERLVTVGQRLVDDGSRVRLVGGAQEAP